VDVGHHYGAPGAISAGGIAEIEFNLELADEVKRSLEHSGVAVRMIGNQVSLRERTREAAGADFVAVGDCVFGAGHGAAAAVADAARRLAIAETVA